MTHSLHQVFPRRVDNTIVHKSWAVDLAAAGRLASWKGRTEARLRQEIQEMAEHFPRWLLTTSVGRDRVPCRSCRGLLVFDRGLRCVECDKPASLTSLPAGALLAWFGLMPPVGIEGLARVKKALHRHPPPLHVLGKREGLGEYLLVPLVAVYPADFPAAPVRVAYTAGLLQVPGMPAEACSHDYHMLSGGFMCLFASGEWRPRMTCREVLQQRAYAHVIKLLNYADGKRDAFAKVS